MDLIKYATEINYNPGGLNPYFIMAYGFNVWGNRQVFDQF